MEVPCTLTFIGQTQYIKKLQKLVASAPAKNVEPPPPKKENADAIVIIDDQVEAVEQTNPQWLKFQGCSLNMETDKEAIISDDLLNDWHNFYKLHCKNYHVYITQNFV